MRDSALSKNIPVGFPSESRRILPPWMVDGNFPDDSIISRTVVDTQEAWPSFRESAMGRPVSRGSVDRSVCWGVREMDSM